MTTERINTVVIGAGQAGLSVGYHLKKRGVPFVILDASTRIGDVWRNRWDSLRLFTPAKFSSLDGLPFPADPNSFPTKDAMGDYLEAYARHFDLPVRCGVRVERVSRLGERFLIVAGNQQFEADNLVIAMANYQRPRVPAFARELNPRIVQLHSFEYRNPRQLIPAPRLSSARAIRAPRLRSTSCASMRRGSRTGYRPRAVPNRRSTCPSVPRSVGAARCVPPHPVGEDASRTQGARIKAARWRPTRPDKAA
jgi:putative flavoprotein involved in K+ transport